MCLNWIVICIRLNRPIISIIFSTSSCRHVTKGSCRLLILRNSPVACHLNTLSPFEFKKKNCRRVELKNGCVAPGTCTQLVKGGHISVLQFEKGPLFTNFWPIKHPYFYENTNFLGTKLTPFFLKTLTFFM